MKKLFTFMLFFAALLSARTGVDLAQGKMSAALEAVEKARQVYRSFVGWRLWIGQSFPPDHFFIFLISNEVGNREYLLFTFIAFAALCPCTGPLELAFAVDGLARAPGCASTRLRSLRR